MTRPVLLRLRSVARTFDLGGRVSVALDEADLVVAAGDLVALHGPSGSGKSTLLHLAAGWDDPSHGEIERHPTTLHGWSGTAVVPQGIGLIPELTVEENVELGIGDSDRDVDAVAVVLARLGLDVAELGGRLPEQLSLGQQQRVAVARAVVARPVMVIADEPTAHQDEVNAGRVFDALRTLATAGTGVLVSTHDVRLLERVDRVVEVVDGRIVD